ncbi:MAG: FGGY-family carbohydrate kinase [Actinomycetota bacterium]|nr:FGGY-family carbohydrate kinase [Actinomycetota bacterium]
MSHMLTPDASTCRRHIARALLEGIAYSARANIEQVVEVTSDYPDTVTVAGGMTRSELWTRIVGNVTGKAVRVPSTPEVSALGATVCASAGAGVFTDMVDGARRLSGLGREHRPGVERERYEGLYAGWREAYDLRAACDDLVAGQMTVALLERQSRGAEAAGAGVSPKILVTASLDHDALRELGEVTYASWREEMSVLDGGQSLVEALRDFNVFVTEMDVVDFEALRYSPYLKVIVCCRVNAVNVDLEAATAFGVPVINTPGRNAEAVADLAVGFMIMLARKLSGASRFLEMEGGRAGDMASMGEAYFTYRGVELWRKTVGLVGLGNVGAQAAALRGAGALLRPRRERGAGGLWRAPRRCPSRNCSPGAIS